MLASGATYHVPVLLAQSLEFLALKPEGTYLDGTAGGGGHLSAIAERLSPKGTVIGLDRDAEAIQTASKKLSHASARVILEQERFSHFDDVCKLHGVTGLDGILLDLGVSSRQIDEPARGFSYQLDAPLDMRMDARQPRTAAMLLESATEEELADILGRYGEVINPRRMAAALCAARKHRSLESSGDVRVVLEKEYGPNLPVKVLSKVFQALRIAVNGELEELSNFLTKSYAMLNLGGRLCIISYHSLEDRLVKNYMRDMEAVAVEGDPMALIQGRKVAMLKRVTKKAVEADEAEVAMNRRSRSARLRVAERVL